ncbi:MAG: hypothetical protein HFG34_09805 [Eubacterium sp.]|nr:hypothetical protein [Eubacterium sp.]
MITIHKIIEEETVDMPDPVQRAAFLKRCTLGGGIVPEGFPVYRGDTRTWFDIERAGGFVPSFELSPGETILEYAKRRVDAIMKVSAPDFVFYWKYPSRCIKEYQPLVFGAEGRAAGVAASCGKEGGQKGGQEYAICLPKLYSLMVSHDKMGAVGVYGDKPSLEESTVLWLHLIMGPDAAEMISLTVIPIDRIQPV